MKARSTLRRLRCQYFFISAEGSLPADSHVGSQLVRNSTLPLLRRSSRIVCIWYVGRLCRSTPVGRTHSASPVSSPCCAASTGRALVMRYLGTASNRRLIASPVLEASFRITPHDLKYRAAACPACPTPCLKVSRAPIEKSLERVGGSWAESAACILVVLGEEEGDNWKMSST